MQQPLPSVLRVLVGLSIQVLVFTIPASAQFLSPGTNANLVRFGYYMNPRDGDTDNAIVWAYTNIYVAIPDGSNSAVSDWQTPLHDHLQMATLNHKSVYLLLMDKTVGAQTITTDAILDTATPFWGQIQYIDIIQEGNLTAAQLDTMISNLKTNLATRGLPLRDIGVTLRYSDAATNDEVNATQLEFVNIEAYLATPTYDPDVDAANLHNQLQSAKDHAKNAGKYLFVTMQSYTMNGVWSGDLAGVNQMQKQVWADVKDDSSVVGLLSFNYTRFDGSKYNTSLIPVQRQIGSLLAISPRMSVDTPTYGATVTQPFNIGGWAIDLAAAPGTGTGVDTLHVWAYPVGGGAPLWVGAATYGVYRPDVGAAFGSTQFDYSGFNLTVSGLPSGTYDFVVFSHSAVCNQFTQLQIVRMTVY